MRPVVAARVAVIGTGFIFLFNKIMLVFFSLNFNTKQMFKIKRQVLVWIFLYFFESLKKNGNGQVRDHLSRCLTSRRTRQISGERIIAPDKSRAAPGTRERNDGKGDRTRLRWVTRFFWMSNYRNKSGNFFKSAKSINLIETKQPTHSQCRVDDESIIDKSTVLESLTFVNLFVKGSKQVHRHSYTKQQWRQWSDQSRTNTK